MKKPHFCNICLFYFSNLWLHEQRFRIRKHLHLTRDDAWDGCIMKSLTTSSGEKRDQCTERRNWQEMRECSWQNQCPDKALGRTLFCPRVLPLSSVSFIDPQHLFQAVLHPLEVKYLKEKPMLYFTTWYCKSLADITSKMCWWRIISFRRPRAIGL